MNKVMSGRITTLGLLMVLMIVFYHGGNGNLVPAGDTDAQIMGIVDTITERLAELAMAYFFTVTAFLFYRNYKPGMYVSKVRSRTKSLLVPYLIWQAGFAAVFAVGGGFSLKNFIPTVFLFQEWPPDGPLWYIYAIFVLALLAPVIYLVVKRVKLGLIAMPIVMIVMFLLVIAPFSSVETYITYGYLSNVAIYFPAYLIGAFLGCHEAEMNRRSKTAFFACMLLLVLIIGAIVPGYIIFGCRCLIPAILIFTFHDIRKIRISSIAGISFIIYAVHRLLVGAVASHVQYLVMKVSGIAFLSDIIGRGSAVLAVIAAAYLIWVVLSKVSPGFLGILTGGRVKAKRQ